MSTGSYVKPELAPGKSQTDCQSCPPGSIAKYFDFHACSSNIFYGKCTYIEKSCQRKKRKVIGDKVLIF